MATSMVAAGKIRLATDMGIPIPEGWALDKNGDPTTSPTEAVTMLPFGGAKASGLAMMFECLSSVMVGLPLLEPTLLGKSPVRLGTQNSIVAALNIGMFTDFKAYCGHIDNLIDGIKGLPTADGFDEVLVPGEPEYRIHDDRASEGIPLPEGTAVNLRDVAQRLGVAIPSWLEA
jgi:ureidoglycolate dehydrogenase (NAD+)